MKKAFITTIALVAVLTLSSCSDNSTHKSKSREKTSSKAETQQVTEKGTLPDIVNNTLRSNWLIR